MLARMALTSDGPIAVTGAAGFLGSHVCRALLARGEEVRAIVAPGSKRSLPADLADLGPGAAADIRDEDAIRKAFAGCKAVIHTAALLPFNDYTLEESRAVNTQGVANVCNACHCAGVGKLVHIGSVHAFGPLRGVAWNNETPLHLSATQPYAASKAGGHREALAAISRFDLDVDIVSPAGLLGPCDAAPTAVGRMLLAIASRKLPCLIKEGHWWCDVRDVAEIAVAAVARPGERDGKAFIVAGTYATAPTLAQLCADVLGRDLSRPTVPLSLAKVGLPFIKLAAKLKGDVPLYSRQSLALVTDCPTEVDESLARERLGYAPRPLAETVGDALEWFIGNEMLKP